MATWFSGSTGTGDPGNPGSFFLFNRKFSGRTRLKISLFYESCFSRFNRAFSGRIEKLRFSRIRFSPVQPENMRAVTPVFYRSPVPVEPVFNCTINFYILKLFFAKSRGKINLLANFCTLTSQS